MARRCPGEVSQEWIYKRDSIRGFSDSEAHKEKLNSWESVDTLIMFVFSDVSVSGVLI